MCARLSFILGFRVHGKLFYRVVSYCIAAEVRFVTQYLWWFVACCCSC